MAQIDKNIGLNKRLLSPRPIPFCLSFLKVCRNSRKKIFHLLKVLSLKVKKSIVKNWKL